MVKVFLFVVTAVSVLVSSVGALAQDYTHPSAWKSGAITGKPVAVKNKPGSYFASYGTNKSQCPRYLKVFDKKASDVKLGTDKPKFTMKIEPQSGRWFPQEIEQLLNKGLAVACTKHKEDTDTKGSFSNECYATVIYK